MTTLTGGSVTYTQRVKTGDYEHKEVAITLNFEGDIAASAVEQARDHARRGLELIPAKPTLAERVEAAKPAAPKREKNKTAPLPIGPHTEAKADDFPGEGQVNGGKTRTVAEQLAAAEPPARIVDTGQKVDPSKMVYPGDSKAASNADLIAGVVPPSGVDRTQPPAQEPSWEDPPAAANDTPEVSNDHLVKTVTAAVGRGIGQPAIRKLFEPLLPKGSEIKLSLIPQAHRQAFLDQVAQLKPIGK